MRISGFVTVAALACGLALFASDFVAASIITSTYEGPNDGGWEPGGNWLPIGVPNNSGSTTYEVVIDRAGSVNVSQNAGYTPHINTLTIGAGDGLTFGGQYGLDVVVGPIVNNGLIALNSPNSSIPLFISADMSIQGNGIIQLASNGHNIRNIFAPTTTHLTHEAGHTIRGAGQLGNNELELTNHGTIEATETMALTVNLTGTVTDNFNDGTIQARENPVTPNVFGTLQITDTELDNTAGLIEALNSSRVAIDHSFILGGELRTSGTGDITLDAVSFQDIFIDGLLKQIGNRPCKYSGQITNNGAIELHGNSVRPASTETTFTGDGHILLVPGLGSNIISEPPGIKRLVNQDGHLIHGAAKWDWTLSI